MFIQGYKFNNEKDYDAFMENIKYFNEKYSNFCSQLKELKKIIHQYSEIQEPSVHFKNYILNNSHFFNQYHPNSEFLIDSFVNEYKKKNIDIKSYLALFNSSYKLKKRGIDNCFFKIVYDKKSLSVSFYSPYYYWFSFLEEKINFIFNFYIKKEDIEQLFFVQSEIEEPKLFGTKNCKYLKTVFKNEYNINTRHLKVIPY